MRFIHGRLHLDGVTPLRFIYWRFAALNQLVINQKGTFNSTWSVLCITAASSVLRCLIFLF